MRRILWIVLLFISANTFAQDKNEFFVKNNGDTVYCDIKKVDLERIKVDKTNGGKKNWDAKELRSFFFENTKWESYLFLAKREKMLFDSKKMRDRVDSIYIFLPDSKKSAYYDLSERGDPFSGYTNGYVSVTTDGKTTFYETKMNGWGANSSSSSFAIFIKNDDLGISGIPIISFSKRTPGTKEETIEILKKYTEDKPELASQFNESWKANLKNIKGFIAQYLGKPLTEKERMF